MSSVFVLTCDQRGSRRGRDEVPAALAALARTSTDAGDGGRDGPLLAAERTAGDEIQTVYPPDAADGVVRAVEALTRLGGWRIGVGIGQVETPLPDSTRAARGPAFISARDAVEHARSTAGQLAVRAASSGSGSRTPEPQGPVGGGRYGRLRPADAAEHALTLLVATLARRTTAGWEIVDLLEQGLNGRQAAERLGISESAVSQRLSRAAAEEGLRARALATDLLTAAVEAS